MMRFEVLRRVEEPVGSRVVLPRQYFYGVDSTASGLTGFLIDCDPVSTDLGLDLPAVRVEHDLI